MFVTSKEYGLNTEFLIYWRVLEDNSIYLHFKDGVELYLTEDDAKNFIEFFTESS